MLGRNGMGKTTTVRTIMGLFPRAGTIAFAGRTIAGQRPDQIARLGIGLVPEGRQVFPNLTVPSTSRPHRPRRKARRLDAARVFELFPRLAARRDMAATSSRAASSRCSRSAARW